MALNYRRPFPPSDDLYLGYTGDFCHWHLLIQLFTSHLQHEVAVWRKKWTELHPNQTDIVTFTAKGIN